MLRDVVETATRLRDEAAATIGAGAGRAGTATRVLIANAGLNPRPLSVVLPSGTAVTGPDGSPLPAQQVDGGLLVHDPDRHRCLDSVGSRSTRGQPGTIRA